jgi:hypothetical protein
VINVSDITIITLENKASGYKCQLEGVISSYATSHDPTGGVAMIHLRIDGVPTKMIPPKKKKKKAKK